jgi:hypothetical protein
MTSLLGAGVLVQIAACTGVGARLLLLARRTRQAPELAFGIAFLLFGVVGYPLSITSRSGLGGAGAGWLLLAALAAQDAGSLAVYLGTRRVFRPRARWALALVAAAAVAFPASLAVQALAGGFAPGRSGGAGYYLGLAARFGAFAWTAVEALRYHAKLRRRLALGLADPRMVDRFRLWAVTNCALCLGFAVFLWGLLASGNPAESALVLVATSAVAVVGGLSMWLAFFPPAAWQRRVAARSESARGAR